MTAGVDLTGAVSCGLTQSEADDLAAHEATIRAGLDTFRAVGRALLVIRDERLYRATHATFEAYCLDRWTMSRPAAYRLVDAAEVLQIVSPMGDTQPENERQTRPLTRLRDEPEAVRSAWSRAQDAAPHTAHGAPKVTAAIVEQAVRDEIAERRGEIAAAHHDAARSRAAIAQFNTATAHLIPQADAERPWAEAVVHVSNALERLPYDLDPAALASRAPRHVAHRLDEIAAGVDWLNRLVAARQEATP